MAGGVAQAVGHLLYQKSKQKKKKKDKNRNITYPTTGLLWGSKELLHIKACVNC
jgi:hypothetical protein